MKLRARYTALVRDPRRGDGRRSGPRSPTRSSARRSRSASPSASAAELRPSRRRPRRASRPRTAREFLRGVGAPARCRITLIAPDGRVLDDTDLRPSRGRRHREPRDREEVRQAGPRRRGHGAAASRATARRRCSTSPAGSAGRRRPPGRGVGGRACARSSDVVLVDDAARDRGGVSAALPHRRCRGPARFSRPIADLTRARRRSPRATSRATCPQLGWRRSAACCPRPSSA